MAFGRAKRIFISIVVVLVLVPGALVLLLKPVLNSGTFRNLAERAVRNMTGLSCHIARVCFDYPFNLRVHGIALEGLAGDSALSVYTGRARVVSDLAGLVRGIADEIRLDEVEVDLELRGEARGAVGTSVEDRSLAVPGWVWRARSASFRLSRLRVSSKNGSVCLEDLGMSWAADPDARAGSLRVSLNRQGQDEQPEDLALLVGADSITVLSGPAVLPALDLPTLIAFAGFDVPLTGTLSGAAFPVPGPGGAEALYLELFSDDLGMSGERLGAGFERGRLRVGGYILLPRQDSGLAASFEEVTASFQGLAAGGRRLGPALEPVELTGSVMFDTVSDLTDWTLEARDRLGNVGIRTAGTLSGTLSGRRQATVSVEAGCADLGSLAQSIGTLTAPLPGGLRLRRGVIAAATLTGDIESLELIGSVKTSGLEVGLRSTPEMPVELDASVAGAVRAGTLAEFRLETNRFEIGGIVSPRASVSYGPAGTLAAAVTIDSVDARNLAERIGPHLPRDLAAYQWAGTIGLSATASSDLRKDSSVQGTFSARLRGGQFASEDYQHMGEKIEFDIDAAVRLPPSGSVADLTLDAAVSSGEVVIGGLYGDLSKTLPRLRADLALDHGSRRLQIRSASLLLDGVGTVVLTGDLSGAEPRGVLGRTRIEAGPIDLAALLDRVLREGLGGLYPGIEKLTCQGMLKAAAELDLGGNSWRALGNLNLGGASIADPGKGFSVRQVDANLPFALARGSQAELAQDPGPSGTGQAKPGTLTVEGIDFRGLAIPKIHALFLLDNDILTLQEPMRIEVAGGVTILSELTLESLGSDSKQKGTAALAMEGLDLAALGEAATGKALEGRLDGRFQKLALQMGTLQAAGELVVRIRDGELAVEGIEVEAPLSGTPSVRCSLRAKDIPLESLSKGLLQPVLEGTLQGEFPSVELSQGRLRTEGALELSSFKGTIRVSGVQAGDLHGPSPFVQMDVDMKEIDLTTLTSPLMFGRVSGVLQGQILGLRLSRGFPYATAFEADLETINRRGVTQKIDARAVETLSKIGGSGQVASALSSGLYRYFDEYYYRKMGLRATLENGWLELHGIPRGKQEYLIVRARRIPTLSMPVSVLTPNRKIRFNRWLEDLMRLGEGHR